MADRLIVPDDDLGALARGEIIVAFAARHEVDLNDELDLVPAGPGGDSESPISLPEGLVGLVVGLQPASSLAGADAGNPPDRAPNGDAVILRVYAGAEPVLADGEFASRRAAVEALFR
jgi:hypothetical protein